MENGGTYIYGQAIENFSILNNSLLSENDIENFIAELSDIIGSPLSVAEKEETDGKYIVVDGTELVAGDYSIKTEYDKITVKGSFLTLPVAMNKFISIVRSHRNITKVDNFEYHAPRKEMFTKEQIKKLLADVYYSDRIIIGEEIQGRESECIEKRMERFYDATGVYPAIMGIDLASYGIWLTENSDAVWSRHICDIVKHCEAGGILTASAHFDNPSGFSPNGDWEAPRGTLGAARTKEELEAAFEELLTEGTEYNKKWKNELDTDARFLCILREQGIPVLWRPLHESNGSWFWFCTVQNGIILEASYLRRMWIYIYEYFTQKYKLDNLIWVFSPNVSPNVNDEVYWEMSPWYCYPGDKYVDIVGVDWYTHGDLEIAENDCYGELVKRTCKIGAITEIGPGGGKKASAGQKQSELYNCMDLYEDLQRLRGKGYHFSYFLTWGACWGIVAMGEGKNFMKTGMPMSREELKKYLMTINKKGVNQ